MEVKTEFFGLNIKSKKLEETVLYFDQINKLAIIFYGNLPNVIICYYVKFPIPIMHRQFFRIISQNREYKKTHCNDLYNTIQFACRTWCLDNQSS